MRVLVTGSTGFVGYWLLQHLREIGDQVLTWPDSLDIRDADAVAGAVAADAPEGIIHLAARASVAASWRDGPATFAVNATGTLHLLDAAAALPAPPRVVLVSSAEVYGTVRPEDLPVGEDRPFAPVSPYGASKAAAEMLGMQAWLGRGVEVVRARPFNHTGPGQRPEFVVPSLARQVVALRGARGDGLRMGNLEARRDLTDVRDVVRAYRALLERGEPGAAYNVCRGSSVPVVELARRLLALAGVDAPVVVDPALVRPVDQPDVRGDPSRLRAATGWEPRVELDRTLADVLAYWSSGGPAPGASEGAGARPR